MPDLVEIRNILFLFSSIISSCASACNLFLLWDLNKWTGYLSFIGLMSIYQLIYDCFFYPAVTSSTDSPEYYMGNVFVEMCGCSASFISNAMMFMVLYIVLYKSSVEIDRRIHYIHLIASIPALYLLALYIYSYAANSIDLFRFAQYSSSWLRIISIILNILPYLYMIYLLRESKSKSLTPKEIVLEAIINALVCRLRYYPLVQALARIGPSWYEQQFGFDFSATNETLLQYSTSILMAILCPLASIGYLIIFLSIQPQAYLHLKSRIFTCKRYVETPEASSKDNGALSSEDVKTSSAENYTVYLENCITQNDGSNLAQGGSRTNSSLSQFPFETMQGVVSNLDESELLYLLDQQHSNGPKKRHQSDFGFEIDSSEVVSPITAVGNKNRKALEFKNFKKFGNNI